MRRRLQSSATISFLFLLYLTMSSFKGIDSTAINLIPLPAQMDFGKDVFTLSSKTKLYIEYPLSAECVLPNFLREAVGGILKTDHPLKESKKAGKYMICLIQSKDSLPAEGYKLVITPKNVIIEAGDESGLFYGVQTFMQLLPVLQEKAKKIELPVLTVTDAPRFPYRGLHLDVSRHFYSKDFVKKMIDAMAYYKLNNFHWHLTDAAGWRIEIKKYPELTDIAAWRSSQNWKQWWKGDRQYVSKNDSNAHGGYYTQEEVKEVVAYAASLHINVIPEIEMPGHSEEVLAVYPQLSCSGEPYKNSDFCVGNEETFRFVEDVLTEVMALFPSQYIHIGGDEAGKSAWKTCLKCQKRMQEEGLKDVDELQSYMIRRVEKFLNENGRTLLGWDEILEGGLAPRAAVMSWRGEEGGIQAASTGHDVIMTPGEFCYFDAYQENPETQPEAIGGFLPVRKVYSYDPAPSSLAPQTATHILGAQANLWTEYVPTDEHAEYMIFPRLLALAEVNWSPQNRRSWSSFKRRLNAHFPRLAAKDINYCPLSNEIDISSDVDYQKKEVTVALDAQKYPAAIRYTTTGAYPTKFSPLYTEPFAIKDSAIVTAAIFENNRITQPVSSKELEYHRAIGQTLTYNIRYSSSYPAGGEKGLIDGLRGGLTYKDNRWQGFLTNLDVVIDMGEVTEISQVQANFMQIIGPGVYFPDYVTVEISDDGVNYTSLVTDVNPVSPELAGVSFRNFGFSGKTTGRYIRFFAKKHNGFQMLDEIRVW